MDVHGSVEAFSMARSERVGHEEFHISADHSVGSVTEERGGLIVPVDDETGSVDHDDGEVPWRIIEPSMTPPLRGPRGRWGAVG